MRFCWVKELECTDLCLERVLGGWEVACVDLGCFEWSVGVIDTGWCTLWFFGMMGARGGFCVDGFWLRGHTPFPCRAQPHWEICPMR